MAKRLIQILVYDPDPLVPPNDSFLTAPMQQGTDIEDWLILVNLDIPGLLASYNAGVRASLSLPPTTLEAIKASVVTVYNL